MIKRNSVVAYRDADRMASVTFASTNVKTGPMAQLQILSRGSGDPVTAVQTGNDRKICGSCIFRGIPGKIKRACYVNLAHAPLAIWRAISKHPVTGTEKILAKLGSKSIRLGSYGDPGFLPLSFLEKLCAGGRRRTGYTHQWKDIEKGFSKFLMASVETLQGRKEAKAKGYRTFRVVSHIDDISPGEILCPNYTKGTLCSDCGLCSGSGTAKDICILAHGGTGNAEKFVALQGIAS